MVAWAVSNFGGMIPKQDPRLLAPNMAEAAVNCDLASGPLDGLPQLEFVVDLAAQAPWPVRKAYRIPNPTPGGPDVWLPLPSEFSSVVRSPLTNDTLNRYYWTNPQGQPAAGVWWNTYARIAAGNTGANAPWNLGFIAPDPGIQISVTPAGGDTTVPAIVRAYCFTYIDQYGLESSPSLPSAPTYGQADGTWTVTGMPGTAPGNTGALVFPAVANMRLYRTITGASTGAQFYYVADIPFDGTGTYVDTIQDTTVVNNNVLITASWGPPLQTMDGMTAVAGGMLIAFSGNTIHFCEPDYPHTWPAGYDVSVIYPIVGLAIWQQSLVVLTQGYPAIGSGATPDTFTFSQLQAPEPCIARGSIITDLAGVYYASQNGLIMLSYYGMINQTLSNMTKNIWLTEFEAATLIACRHRSQYLALTASGNGFLIDYSDQRMGVTQTMPFGDAATALWNDVYTGNAYVAVDGEIYLWDSPDTPSQVFRWRSKQFYLPAPASLGACQVSLDSSVADAAPPATFVSQPDDIPDGMNLPPGINALFRLFAGPEGKNLVHEQFLQQPREIFRLPSGRKVFCYQFEILSRVPVHSVELASTMRELKKV